MITKETQNFILNFECFMHKNVKSNNATNRPLSFHTKIMVCMILGRIKQMIKQIAKICDFSNFMEMIMQYNITKYMISKGI